MPYRPLATLAALVLALCALVTPATARAEPVDPADVGKPIVPPGLEDVGVDEHLDGQIPMDALFRPVGEDGPVRRSVRRQAPGRPDARLPHLPDSLFAGPEPDRGVAHQRPLDDRQGV